MSEPIPAPDDLIEKARRVVIETLGNDPFNAGLDVDAADLVEVLNCEGLLAEPALKGEVERLRSYAETTRHHQRQHAEAYRELTKVRAERDQLQAQLADAETNGQRWCRQWLSTRELVGQLQARIDAALAELDRPAPQVSHGGNALWDVQTHWQQQVQVVRAALLRNQPTEPDTRCMNGPARERTLHMVGIIKALKSAAEMDHLPLEPPRRDNFARLARAIAGHWPRDIDRPSSPVDSGEAPANPEEQCAVAEPLNRHRCQRPAGHDVHRWSAGPLERDVWHCRPGEPVVTPRADPAVPSTPEEQP
jgi:hypothetical protein